MRAAAARLGVSPQELATVIAYETRGTFSPHIRGGTGQQYIGLIQFGPHEQSQYGATQHQTFAEQVPAIERYLTGRGFRPGMGLRDLYSTVNAGSPGHYHSSDRPGMTVDRHISRMIAERSEQARQFLASGVPQSATHATGAPSTPHSQPSPATASAARLAEARTRLARRGDR